MPVLKFPRHEQFAQYIAQGKTADEAYELAGFKPNRHNASRLKTKDNVSARIAEIVARKSEKTQVSQERVVSELAKLGFSNMLDYITIGADGLPFTDFTNLTRDQAAAISELVVESKLEIGDDGDGGKESVPVRKVRFKLADKRAALVDIGKHLGMFKESVNLNLSLSIADLVNASFQPAEKKAEKD